MTSLPSAHDRVSSAPVAATRLPRWTRVTPLLAWLAASAAVAVEPWSPAADALLQRPGDPVALRALADALGRVESTREPAAAGLRQLLATRKMEGELERSFVMLLLTHPTEAGWRDLYLLMSKNTDDREEAVAFQVRAAHARLLGGELADAVRDLRGLHLGRPDRADAALLYGHALLLSGDAKAAVDVFGRQLGQPEAREGFALAATASGRTDPAWWRTVVAGAPGVAPGAAEAVTGEPAAQVELLRGLLLGAPSASGPRLALASPPAGGLGGLNSRLALGKALRAYGYDRVAVSVLRAPAAEEPADVAAAVQQELGRALLRLGDAAGAEAAAKAGLARLPGDKALTATLAEAKLRQRHFAEAAAAIGSTDAALAARITTAEAAVAAVGTVTIEDDGPALNGLLGATPTDTDLVRTLALRLAEAGKVAEARAGLFAAVTANPGDVDLLGRYVNVAMQDGAVEEAAGVVHRALALTSSDTARGRLLGSLRYVWIKKAEAARDAGRHDDARDAFAVSHMLAPTDPGVLRALGGARWTAGALGDAWTAYVAAYRLEPTEPGGLDALVALAAQTRREDELRRLLGPYEKDARVQAVLRKLDMASETATADRALQAGQVDEAYTRYLRLQAKDPSNASVLRGLGTVLLVQNKPDEALAYFLRAHALEPQGPWSKLGEANARIALGELETARALVEELSKRDDPGLAPEVRSTRRRLLVAEGERHAAADRDEQAYTAFTEALTLQADTWGAHQLANLYAKHRQFDLAQAFYEESWRLDTTNIYPRLGRAALLVRAGWFDEAATLLDTLPATDPDVIAARADLDVARAVYDAELARRVGDEEQASALLRAVLERYPDNQSAKAAWATDQLDARPPEEALATAKAMLLQDPVDTHALGAALTSAHKLGRTETILPLFEAASARDADLGGRWLARARVAAAAERAVKLDREGRHDDALQLLDATTARVTTDLASWSILGGAWLELRETKRAIAAFDAALAIDPTDSAALGGKAGTLATMGRTADGIELLESAWAVEKDIDIGLALADLYRARRQLKQASEMLDGIDALGNPVVPKDPLPAFPPPSGAEVVPFEIAPGPTRMTPSQEERRRTLRRDAPESAWLPGFDVGAGIYARPGVSGRQFLTAFFTPVRLHELRAGPIAFDIEAVPYFLSDYASAAYGAQLSAGIQAGIGPVSLHARGGVSPVGFETRPYFIWYGSVDVRASKQVALGVFTSRDPVTDSLTSWAGKEDPDAGFYGRVSRTGFGGYLNITPTEVDKIGLSAKGGWNDGLLMPRVGFWEAMLQGSHDFVWPIAALRVGGNLFGMSFSDQLDKFRPGEGGFFAPELFIMGAAKAEARFNTRDDRFNACLGGSLGAQYLQAEDPDLDPDAYIRPGVYPGYSLAASLDWRMARSWWLGLDYGRTVTGRTWQQNIAMIHLHFGPNDAWSRRSYPSYSPLAGQPVVQGQPCGS